jgi:hypothetical protein
MVFEGIFLNYMVTANMLIVCGPRCLYFEFLSAEQECGRVQILLASGTQALVFSVSPHIAVHC